MALTLEEFQKELSRITDKKERIRSIQKYVWPTDSVVPSATALAENHQILNEAYELALEINDKWGLAYSYINKAFVGLFVTQDPKTIEYFETGLAIFKEIENPVGVARTFNMMAYSLWSLGKYDEALEYAFNNLKHAENYLGGDYLGWANYTLGVFHYDLKDYSASEGYYKKAFDYFKAGENALFSCSRCQSGLGSVMIATKRFDEALEFIRLSAEGFRETKNVMGEGRALNDMGVVLKLMEKYQESEKYLKESLQLREDLNHYQGVTTTCIELGSLYLKINEYETALKYLHRALEIAESSKSKPKIYQVHELLGEVYKHTGELAKALEHKEKFYELKTEVTGELATNKLKNLQTQFATEKSERESEIHRLKNVELKKAYEEIEEKNKSIIDSINYAKRIQQAILPSDTEVNELLPESFVLYLPKDVVSGDFYWIANKGGKKIFAAIDCTGHGVPGAFMSMIGHTLLNGIVNHKGITTPNEILAHLRKGVINSLKQTGIAGESQDGMDIALCTLDGQTLEYAGANNPLWFIREGKIEEIKADKQPIGIYYGEPKPFVNHSIELNKGDCIYIFTDGYADQAGGPKEKKFRYKQMQELILENYTKSMSEQKEIFLNTINNWKGNLEQVDDILLLGIKI
ncbi:MAG: tetratricopeptide repeat protein [Bacteroidota bacterium]